MAQHTKQQKYKRSNEIVNCMEMAALYSSQHHPTHIYKSFSPFFLLFFFPSSIVLHSSAILETMRGCFRAAKLTSAGVMVFLIAWAENASKSLASPSIRSANASARNWSSAERFHT